MADSVDSIVNFDEQFGWDTLFGEKEDHEDPNREVEAREIVYMWEKVFDSIGTPNYQNILDEASNLFIELPSDDYIDPQMMMYSYAKAIAYRNKLIRIKIKLRRISATKSRSLASMSRSIIGKQKGTKAVAESKAADLLAEYERQAGDAKDALETVNDIIENLDSTAMQLSRILRLMEVHPNKYYMDAGNQSSTDEVEQDTGDWGSAGRLTHQMKHMR